MPEFPTGSDTMTVQEYLEAQLVTCTPCHPDTTAPVTVAIPQLPGWVPAPPEAVPGAYTALVNPTHIKDSWCPNAVLLHGKLSTTVDAEQLLNCAFADSRRLPDWREYESNHVPYQGHPSVFVRGVYTVEQWTLSATTRYTVVNDGPHQYLTQLTVTTLLDQADDLDVDVTVINLGLTVTTS
ncbi:LpqN/LpqT family lipoprotein [Rhodococcus spongiicola]|uniref:Lipoprotein LpqN n=1 Tax=Rhodococcus spongiicola TaxID=2487352 RepID=A0A438AP02_9NOCA|nr:LpqN/LpqT family lipoprotein [Rhodococcus spongiicola]RVW00379.1 hypothetical protein EF834_17110 [Rhodococcus spongiicola]